MTNKPHDDNGIDPFAPPTLTVDKNTNPYGLFGRWLSEAEQTEPNDPNAMALSTVDGAGRISCRMVLLKSFDQQGFVFYTNRDSDKGRALRTNPTAALLFHWKSLRRQVRIEGKVKEMDNHLADDYFQARPRDSQIGAWASQQSRPMTSRQQLVDEFHRYQQQFATGAKPQPIPRPSYWVGYRLIVDRFEFWQDRRNRLHERLVFINQPTGVFTQEILFP